MLLHDTVLPGEVGDQVYDGKYCVCSVQVGDSITLAPDLQVMLLSEDNRLRGVAGFLSVVFRLDGKNFPISLCDHDLRPTAITHDEGVSGPQWTTFSNDAHSYRVIGVCSEITLGRTYLQYRVTRTRLSVG